MIWDGIYEAKDSQQPMLNSCNPQKTTALSSRQLLNTDLLPSGPAGAMASIYGCPVISYRGVWYEEKLLFGSGKVDIDCYDKAYQFLGTLYNMRVPECQLPRSTRLVRPSSRTSPATRREVAKKREIVERINKKFRDNAIQKASIKEVVSATPKQPVVDIKLRLDFWNYPDWDKSGNLKDGAQPFWMFDNVEPKPHPVPEPPKPTHKRVVKKVAGVEVIIMEPL